MTVICTAGIPPHIDANGDGIGNYNIYQLNDMGYYQIKSLIKKKIFRGTQTYNFLLILKLFFRKGLKRWDGSLPLSVCSTNCPRGYYRAYQDQNCCWTCIPCDVSTSIIVNETNCVQCPLGYGPNEDLLACKLIPPTTLEYNSPWVVLPAVCSTLGIAATLFVVGVFIRYNSTPVIMASGRELCYFMLGGILLCYLVTFILISKPNVLICAASRILIGLSMSAIYAAILTKTNLLARIFLMQDARHLDCIVPSAQIAICFGIVSIQLIGSLIWLLIDPPGITVLFPSREETILTCKARASHLLISLLYNMFLIVACTLYAFKTRKIPENFNETRLIGFTMYSTSILWLSFGPIYFATQNNFKIKFSCRGNSPCQAVLCVTPTDTLALVLTHDVIVEITLYKHIRICRIGGVAATICNGGRVAAVHHPSIEIVQEETQVLFDMVQGPRVRASSDAVHVLGVEGTDPTTLVHSITDQEVRKHKNSFVATGKFYLRRDIDNTAVLFLNGIAGVNIFGLFENQHERCMTAAKQAILDQKGNQLNAIIQGVKVKHDMETGDTRIYCGRNFISLCVASHALTLHSPWVDINVDSCSCTRLRRGEQIIETDGNFLRVTQNNMHADFTLNNLQSTADSSPSNEIQMTSLCMCISMSGTVALCCFFAPKVYIAVCQPYKNVRTRQSAVGRLVNQQMRTSAEKNSVTSSQITQQYETISPIVKKSHATRNAKCNNNDISHRSNNSIKSENSQLLMTTPFQHQSSNNISHPDDELAKETIIYQNNAELFFEQLFANYDD
ncbi:unnamed protein product [Onchocerca flexuosa]|uniref:G_PROTEIN_RECEP_F3_4 domain-containing protein n=1 Tax=Onchocerca flexuosa TaxID=387005 RepID=A0A183H356_9BILA|nr:unnamed protein product [Onchocerca flexuosa]